MSEAAFTPGPWRAAIEPDYRRRSDECDVEVCCVPHATFDAIDVFGPINLHHTDDYQQHYANARLIATAPDLYEALEGLLEDFEKQMKNPSHHIPFNYEKAKAALAKARGETP